MASSSTNKILWVFAISLVFAAGIAYLIKENARIEYEKTIHEYESRPEMPIELNYRKALMGPGLVIVFKNTSTRHLSMAATFVNPTLKKEENYRLDLSPGIVKEIGHIEGWAFSSGDVIKLTHNEYKTKVHKLP